MGGVSMEWKEDVLGNVLEVKYGKDHKKLADGQYPVYGSGGLMRYVDSKLYDGPSILIPRKGTLNNIMFVDNPFWTVDTMFWSIINTDKVDPKFLFYSICKRDFASMNVGSAVPSMTVNILNDIQISYPKNIEEQRRIASILSSLDRKIELNNKINADLEEMAQAIFKNWFVDFESFKDGKFVDSELGMIPEGWKVGTLDEIFSLKYGKNLSTSMILETGDYPVYGANGIIGYYNEYNCDKYSVLVTSRGNGSGDVSRTHHPKSFITNNSFVVEPLEQYKYIELPFINGLFNIINFKSYCSGSAQPQLTNKAMRNICIISPPMEIVIKYCEMLETLFSHIECVIAENSRLSLLRDTLLPRLMSGELEVPE